MACPCSSVTLPMIAPVNPCAAAARGSRAHTNIAAMSRPRPGCLDDAAVPPHSMCPPCLDRRSATAPSDHEARTLTKNMKVERDQVPEGAFPRISRRSQALARRQSRRTVSGETARNAAVSSTLRPPKNRNSMTRAFRSSNRASAWSASSSAMKSCVGSC